MKKTLLTLSILAALGTLTACGGGGGGGSNPAAPAGTKSVTGVISAKSAAAPAAGVAARAAAAGQTTLTVNGAQYTVDADTSIDADDAAGDESDIAEGDVVTIEASDEDGDGVYTATAVEYDDETQGYVLAANLADDGSGAFTGTLNVMGKVITVTAETVYEPGDLVGRDTIDLLATGDVVEVSGYPDADGNVIATRIEGKDPSEDIEVKGVVSNITATTFDLGTLTVDFGSAPADMSDIAGGLVDGLYVEVKADADINALSDDGDGTFTLIATEVEVEDGGDMDDDSVEEGEDMEISGVLTIDGGVASVNGQVLAASAADGVTDVDFTNLEGQLVVVEGYMEAGVMMVVEINAAE